MKYLFFISVFICFYTCAWYMVWVSIHVHMWVAEDGFLPLPLSHRRVVPGGACPTGGSFLEAPLSHRMVLPGVASVPQEGPWDQARSPGLCSRLLYLLRYLISLAF